MSLEYAWWATQPRCEFCRHWEYRPTELKPLSGRCREWPFLIGGEIMQSLEEIHPRKCRPTPWNHCCDQFERKP